MLKVALELKTLNVCFRVNLPDVYSVNVDNVYLVYVGIFYFLKAYRWIMVI
jgi:hypothetical protein